MTPELENTLVQRYPEIFRDHRGDPKKTCMAWGLDVDDGWFDLIDVLCGQLVGRLRQENRQLQYLTENLGNQVGRSVIDEARVAEQQAKVDALKDEVPVAAQVKEKFGGLRFYVNSATPEQYAAIEMAESFSTRLCEACGNRGRSYNLGWVRTMCDLHADEQHGAEVAQAYRDKFPARSD